MTDPTHVYLNLDVVNNSTTTANPLIFNETRNMPFLSSSDNYFCSVVRFTLQTSNSLPVFIPDIRVGQNDVNQTVYGITLALTRTSDGITRIRSAYVSYQLLDTTQPTPSSPTTQLGNSLPYYFIYNVNDWVDMLNEAFQTLTIELRSAFPAEPPLPAFLPPFVSYDISSGLFTINKDNSVDFVGSGGSYSLNIYFNARLYNILPFSSQLLAAAADLAYNTTYKLNIFQQVPCQHHEPIRRQRRPYPLHKLADGVQPTANDEPRKEHLLQIPHPTHPTDLNAAAKSLHRHHNL